MQILKTWRWLQHLALLGLVFGVSIVASVAADEVKWVTVEGTARIEKPGETEKARAHAILVAERNALSEALAKEVSLESLLVNLRLNGGFGETIPYGRISSEKILEEGPVQSESGKEDIYRVLLKAGVVRESSSNGSSFSLYATINQPAFKEGDALEIRVRSTADCYLAVYNIMENKKIIRLYPNYLSNNNALKANVDWTFPGPDKNDKSLRLLLHLPENKEATTEHLYFLAITRPFGFEKVNIQEGIHGVYDGETAFMKDLVREVVSLPLENRAEFLMQYEIRKK